MSREAMLEQAGEEGPFFHELAGMARACPVPGAAVPALLIAGAVLGALADALLRVPPPLGLNMSIWIASVAATALVLSRRASLSLDGERVSWLAAGVLFAAGLSWRDSTLLKPLALAAAIVTFAIAAHHPSAAWVRAAGVTRYAGAVALGALHAWTAAVLAIVDAMRLRPRAGRRTATSSTTASVARGLALAAPLVAVFAGLFISADAAFERLIENALRFDFEWIGSHILLFTLFAWISTGYLRGFLSCTAQHSTDDLIERWPVLGATELATALAAINVLFAVFVVVQLPYMFGADTFVQLTPDLTYAEYARRGFFELVVAVGLVVPILLTADWFLDSGHRRGVMWFRVLAILQVGLVLAIAASALHRLRLYHAGYGLTESRFYAMVLLVWMSAMLLWLAATVLRGRRERFAFGTLVSGLATVAMLFVINPDALIARTNVARMYMADTRVRFDVAYAASLSADAVPVLIDALPVLPADVQCPIARHMLRRWPPAGYRYLRSWNWSSARAADLVRRHEAWLRSLTGPELACAAPR